MNLKSVSEDILNFLIENDMSPPSSVIEYDMLATTMHKHHRSVLSKNGILCSEVMHTINPDYVDAQLAQRNGLQYYKDKGELLGLDVTTIVNIHESLVTQKMLLKVTCKVCGFSENITGTSINRRKNGCKKCNGQTNWINRQTELLELLDNRSLLLVADTVEEALEDRQHIDVECLVCGHIFTRALNTIVNTAKYLVECPSCCPPPIFGKCGRKSIVNGTTFDSLFEAQTYSKLLHTGRCVQVHVPYADIVGDRDSKLIADFLLDNKYVIEVSTFNLDNHPTYNARIILKRKLVSEYSRLTFVFLNTLAEVDSFVSNLNN